MGGAIWANAGAHEADVAARLVEASVLEADGTEAVVRAAALGARPIATSAFKTAHDRLRPRVVILGALPVEPAEPATDHRAPRRRSAAGGRRISRSGCRRRAASSATRPTDPRPGRLIDGRSGSRARASAARSSPEKHANFIVNDQKGTAADVRRLAESVQATVLAKPGVGLRFEVVFAGDWSGWERRVSGSTPGGRHPSSDAGRPPIVVLLGGPSAEHDVSIVSGRAIAAGAGGRWRTRSSRWLIGLDGDWWRLPHGGTGRRSAGRRLRPASRSLARQGPMSAAARARAALGTRAAAGHVDRAARPVRRGRHAPGAAARSAALTYTGSGVAASALGMDKVLFKRLARALGMPVVPFEVLSRAEHRADPTAAAGRLEAFAGRLPDPRLMRQARPAGLEHRHVGRAPAG